MLNEGRIRRISDAEELADLDAAASSEERAYAFIREVSAALAADRQLPALGEGIPMDEIRSAMMRVYPLAASAVEFLSKIVEMDHLLPVSAVLDRPLLREVLYATLLRPLCTDDGPFSWADYDTVTLAWRCTMGPLHPEDDNDVCPDAFVEWKARILQRERPGLSRETARIEAFLMKSL